MTCAKTYSALKVRLKVYQWGFSLLAIAAYLVGCRTFDTIPKDNLTETRLAITRVRLRKYWDEYGKVPANPRDLPLLPNRDCSMTDAWGKEFQWLADDDSTVRVISFGKDGIVGGTGENADLEILFDGRVK